MTDDACLICGHAEDEHEDSWLAPCEVEGCECFAYDPEATDGRD
jgi:hypothetical protein